MNIYSILIPAYEAEKYLSRLLEDIHKVEPEPDEIFVVDDGSSDNTNHVAKKMGAIVIRHKFNKGKGAALKTGFKSFMRLSQSKYLLCMDADLQHPVSEIPKFIAHAEQKDSTFIIGNRLGETRNMPIHRRMSNKVTSFILSKLTGQRIKDSQCGYRLIHRSVLQELQLQENGFQLESEMILKASERNFIIDFVDIKTVYHGESSQIQNVADTFKFVLLIFSFIIHKIPWFTREN